MPSQKCPFSIVQASGGCACEHAQEVIRRGGSEYDCTDNDKQDTCSRLVTGLNQLALPALGYEDDLTLTPKSVYERVLLGGLHGLAGTDCSEDARIENIWVTVESALNDTLDWAHLDADQIVPSIEACKIKRRRRR